MDSRQCSVQMNLIGKCPCFDFTHGSLNLLTWSFWYWLYLFIVLCLIFLKSISRLAHQLVDWRAFLYIITIATSCHSALALLFCDLRRLLATPVLFPQKETPFEGEGRTSVMRLGKQRLDFGPASFTGQELLSCT